MIACVLLPYFAAAVHRKIEPALLATPLLIASSGKVYGVSAEAAEAGAKVGMQTRTALALCSGTRVVEAAPSLYRRASEKVIEALRQLTSRVEGTPASSSPFPSDDGLSAIFYLDFERLSATETLAILRQTSAEIHTILGASPAVGLSSGKFPARMAAARAGPGGEHFIPPGTEVTFLADIPVSVLPLDEPTLRRLHLLGLRSLGDVGAIAPGHLGAQFGRRGLLLHQLARGIDPRPVIPAQIKLVIHASRHTEGTVDNRLSLEIALRSLAVELSEQLERSGKMARAVEFLALGEKRYERRLTLRRPLQEAKALTETLLGMSTALRTGVTEIEVILSDFSPARARQLELLGRGSEGRAGSALQSVTARYSAGRFCWPMLREPASRIPERKIAYMPVEGA